MRPSLPTYDVPIQLDTLSPDQKLHNESRSRPQPVYNYATLLVPIVLFPLSTAVAFVALTSVPLPHPLPTAPTAASLSIIVDSIQAYAFATESLVPTLHLLLVLSILTVWKHAWSIPGALLLNMIAGGLWGGVSGTIVMTLLTAVGSVASTILSRCLSRWIEGLMPRAVEVTKNLMADSRQLSVDPNAIWIRLALLRLTGVVPWSGINIASGIIRIPLVDCFISALIGCTPWTAVTCHVGAILHTMSASLAQDGENERTLLDVLKTRDVVLKLLLLTALSLTPILARKAMKSTMPSTPLENSPDRKLGDVAPERPRKSKWRWNTSTRGRTLSLSWIVRHNSAEKNTLPVSATAWP